MSEAMTYLDFNAAAGELRDLFEVELTSAVCQCAACGFVAQLAMAHVYNQAPGTVVRCSRCENVLMRLVKKTGSAWIDLRGLTYMQIATTSSYSRGAP